MGAAVQMVNSREHALARRQDCEKSHVNHRALVATVRNLTAPRGMSVDFPVGFQLFRRRDAYL